MIEVVGARPVHVGPIANRMRDVDKLECGIAGYSPKEALRYGMLNSTIAWTVLVDGRAEAMFGVCPVSTIESRGRPWLLMTDDALKHRRAILRLGWRYTQAIHRHFAILENYVYARNDVAIRWLARLGYAVGPVDTANGQPIRRFIRCVDRPLL
jgi:hypothetical protein